MDFKLNHGFDFPKPPLDLLTFGKSVPRGLLLRETGFKQKQNCVSKEFQSAAEDKLVLKNHELMHCTLPGSPTRSTFLMVFSPDGKRVASTHGNHNIYVTDLTSGKNINTLSGHPRTPWCIAFHPSSNQILASGCLAGQVRVWDLSGGSETWTVQSQTVIASIAFHPTDRMLVIATYNELYFWDWSQPEPFAKCHTSNEKEKVRYVAFDPLGHKIITGISNALNIPTQWDRVPVVVPPGIVPPPPPTQAGGNSSTGHHRTNVAPDQERRISMCYRSLVEQYDQLVRRYYDLSRSRATPTMDRGTDPMDMEAESSSSPGYFQPPTTSRSANWRSASQSRGSARMSIHHTQRRPARSRRFNTPYASTETQPRGSRPHSESLSRRRFFHCHRRRRPSCGMYADNAGEIGSSHGTETTSAGATGSSHGTEQTSASATDHRVHVRTYEVGRSGPVLPSFSLSHYLQDALRAAATDERSPRGRQRSDVPPPPFLVSQRSAFVPRTPSGWRPLPRLSRFNVSPVRESGPEGDSSSDVGVRYGIQLLSRHIDNMQQLCRARLEILQLQQIRRMWEHLQRQIRSLHVAVRDSSTVPITHPEPSRTSASHTRPQGTSTYQLRNLASLSGLRRSSSIPTPEGMPSRSQSASAQEETQMPSSSQRESPYVQRGNPLAGSGSWGTEDEFASTTSLSTTASSAEDNSVGDEDSSTLATAGSSSSQASNSNNEPEVQQSSLMSLLPFRRLSRLRRRRLLSAFMRIEREMGIGQGLSTSPAWRLGPTNPFQRLTRDNSCDTNEGNVPQSSQSSFRCTGRKNYSYNLRNQSNLARNNEKASQSQTSKKKTKDECQVVTPSHIESEPGPSTSNGSSSVSGTFSTDFMAGSSEAPQPGVSGLGSLPGGIQRTAKSGDTGKKTEKPVGKKLKLDLPPWRLPTVPENITFERSETIRGSTRSHRSEDTQMEETSRNNNNANTAESQRMSKPSSFRKKPDPASLPSTSRSTDLQDSIARSTESMTLRPMIAQLEALVRQQRSYQCSQQSGASDGSPLTHSTTEESRPRPTSRATGASPTSAGLLRNYNAGFREGAHNSSGSSSETGLHRPSAEERLTSALENETDHVNRLHQRPPGPRATQRRSGEVEATRLRARQVLSLMVESLTQFFEENGLSGNAPQPGVLDDQIYNLYVLLQLALELTDLLLAQLVSTRHELEHQWTHRLRSPVALDASTGVEPQRVYARTRGSMRGRREYRNMLRLIAQQRHEHYERRTTRNEDPPTQPSPTFSSLVNRNAEMRNDYIMRVQRFRNAMPQAAPGPSAVQETVAAPIQQPQEVFTVPLVRLNDVLVLDTASLNHQPRQRPQSPPLDFPGTVPHPQQLRYLHPRYFYPQHFDSAARQQDPGIDLRASPIASEHMMSNDTPTMPTHRIQAWDFSRPVLPNISNAQENIVASECKIHNDASVDISNDGHLLVTLLPSGRLSMSTMLGIYSLQWHTLGQCLYTTSFEQNAVSVSLSPISRHLLVGLACRRVAPMSNDYLPMAQIFRLDGAPIPGAKGRLCLLRDVEQGREQGYMSINCIRWAPRPGQGLVYGTNTGQLKVLR